MRHELGRIEKSNITLIEYAEPDGTTSGAHFLQCGVVGLFATKKELKDLYDVLNYYVNIESFSQCKVKIEGEYVSIS